MHGLRFAFLAAAVTTGLWSGGTAHASRPLPAARSHNVCTMSPAHPIGVRVTALDPIARGAQVRLRVLVTSEVGLDGAEASLVSTGGAANRGPSSIALGSLGRGRSAQGLFTVAVPPGGGRQYVQFQVTGQGPNGRLVRGACYNLLPDGPAEQPRPVVTPQGARVIEVAAQRIDQ